jgi:outer membrane receptor protein involved in Fe transport
MVSYSFRFIRFFFLFLTLQFLVSAVSGAQQGANGSVTGKVFDKTTKQPLEYATIVVINKQTGKIVTGNVADVKGVFRVSNIPAGVYIIEIDFIGYEKSSVEGVKIGEAGSSVSLGSVFLSPSTHSLEGVIVTADKPVVESKIDKIVYNASSDITSQGGLAIDVLKKVPQVSVDIDGNVELQGNSNIRFLINGKPSSVFGNSISDALASIPASQIKSIEAITNPGAKYDSQGTGGIINIILLDNKMDGINSSISLSAGSRLENGSANINIRHNNFGINAFFSGNAQLKSEVPFTQNRVSTDLTGENSTSLNQSGTSDLERNGFRSGLGFDWNISKRDNIIGSVGFNQFYNRNTGVINQEESLKDISGATLSDINTIRNADSWSRFKGLDYSLEYKKKFSREGQELDILYNASNGRPNSEYSQTQTYKGEQIPYSGSASINPGTDNENDISLDYAQPVSANFLLETGVKGEFFNINSINDASVFSPSGDLFVPDSLQSYNMMYKMKVYAGYLSASFKLFGLIDLKAGVRYEHTDVSIDYPNTTVPSYGNFVPSVVISHNFNKNSTLKLAYGKRIERPEYRELNPFVNLSDPYYITTGNPMLKPEIGHNFELGYSTSLKNGGNIYVSLIERINTQDKKQITTFYPTYQIGDSIYNNVSVSSQQNIGSEYNSGISASGSIPLTKSLNIRGNLMMTFRYIVSDVTGNMAIGFRTRLNLNATWQLPRDLIIEAFGNYSAPSHNVQGKVPQFFIYTFAFRKMFLNKNTSLGFTTTNPFNRYVKQETTISTGNSNSTIIRHMPLRSFGISFTYKFGKIEFSKNNKDEEDNSFLNNQGSSR